VQLSFYPLRYATDWDWVWCITYFFVFHAQCITTLYLSLFLSFLYNRIRFFLLFPQPGEGEGWGFFGLVFVFCHAFFLCVRRGEKKWCFFFTALNNGSFSFLFCFVWLLGEGEGEGRGEGSFGRK